jgi:hypothetical protein
MKTMTAYAGRRLEYLTCLAVSFCIKRWASCLIYLFGLASALTFPVTASGQPGTTWALRNPLPTNEFLHAAAWSGSHFAVVGNGGLILTSPDAITWTKRSSGVSATLLGLVHTGSQFVAVGEGGTILTSPDGTVWTKRISSTAKTLQALVWTGSTLVTVGEDGTALTSTTGTTWTTRFTGTSLDLTAAVWTGTQLLAVGELGITLESSTGSTWAQTSQTPTLSFTSLAWDGAQFIACTSGGTLHTSPTGVIWTQRHASGASLAAVLWTGSTAVATGSDGTILTSPDAITWTAQSSGSSQFLLGIAKGGSTVLVVGAAGALLTSTNTTTWTDRSVVSHVALNDIAWTGLKMVAVGLDGGVLSSADGVVWAVESLGSSDDLKGVVWAGDKLVAVGQSGVIHTSPDGVTWTPRTSGTAQDLLAAAWTRNLVITVGANGTIRTSPDGITWTARTSGTPEDLRSVTWTGAQALAVGTNGAICSSTDGITWTASTTAPLADLNAVTWSGKQFCAVGDGDIILTSPSGAVWTQRSISFGQNLLDVVWAGTQFVAVGTSQLILTSTNGTSWTQRTTPSVKLPTLRGVDAFGSMLVAIGDSGDILTSGSSPALVPVVNFASTSQLVSENVGAVVLGVQLSFAPAVKTTIPLTLGGTTTSGKDLTLSSSTVTFAAGQSAKSIIFTVKDDALVESAETLIVSIAAPLSAIVGAAHTFTLTITDNDIAPLITLSPTSQLVAQGAPITTFTAAGTGSPPLTFQWKKNGASISGASSTNYSVLNALLKHAGKYHATASNPTGTATSSIAELGVVNTSVGSVQVPLAGTARITIQVAGNGLSFQWRKNGVPMSNGGRISGVTTDELTITALVLGDTDNYDCIVTGPGGVLAGGPQTLTVLMPPVVTPTPLPPTMISSDYAHTLVGSNIPTQFTASGLPKGLLLNSSTGLISGRAVVSGTYNVQVTARNAAGTSPIWVGSLIVQALPAGSVGSFQAQVDRDASINDDLGGRLELTTTTIGSCSGKLTLGRNTYNFTGKLDTTYASDPEISLIIPRSSLPDIELDLTLAADFQTLVGTVGTGGPSVGLTGWRQVWNAATQPASNLAGYYSLGLDIQGGDIGQPSIPQGTGYLTCTVSLDGKLTFTGKTSEGAGITSATFLGPNGEALVFQTLYSHTGSVLGTLTLTPDIGDSFNDNAFSGSLDWLRAPQPLSQRSYQSGFGPTIIVASGKYLAADSKSIVLGLPASTSTAKLLMASGGVEASATNPDVNAFTYTDAFEVIMPIPGGPQNPGKATLTLNKSTGMISGKFTLVDGSVTRIVSYQGMVIRPTSGDRKAFGFYNLAQLPNPNTSDILSGQVVIEQP